MKVRLERKLVFVRSDFRDKKEVVDFLGKQLVQAGAVDPEYVKAMHKREEDIGTYITEGVAIPHGTEASRSLVKRAAVAVLKISAGVDWLNGQRVYLAFGIAGNDDEHVALLGSLATLLMDSVQKEKLMAAKDEDELFAFIDQHMD